MGRRTVASMATTDAKRDGQTMTTVTSRPLTCRNARRRTLPGTPTPGHRH